MMLFKFIEKTATKMYNEFLSEAWLLNNDFVLALLMLFHLTATLLLIDLWQEGNMILSLLIILFALPWVIMLACSFMALGMTNGFGVPFVGRQAFFVIVLKPIEWYLGNQMLKEQMHKKTNVNYKNAV